MRTTMTVLVACLALAATGACKKKKDAGSGSGSGSGSAMAGSGSDSGSGSDMAGSGSGSDTMAGSGSDMAGSGSGSDAGEAMQHMAGNCPSTVLGASTKVELKGKAVVLTISATDKDAIASIQKRTEELLKDKSSAKQGDAHDRKGSQGGGKGLCPVFWEEGGKAVAKNDKSGTVVTITPKDKPEDLKATIDDRIKKTEDWVKEHIKPGEEKNQGGVGGGGGEHGSTHSGSGDGKGKERKGGDGGGGGGGTGGGGGKGTGGGGSGNGAGNGAKKGSGGGGW
jgi:hypothetical protein